MKRKGKKEEKRRKKRKEKREMEKEKNRTGPADFNLQSDSGRLFL